MPLFYVYIHSKPNGVPFYVGKGKGGRAFCLDRKHNPHHQSTVAKYGSKNIRIEVIPCESEQEAFDTEVRAIAKLREAGVQLCNFTNGGEGSSGRLHLQETKDRISAKKTGCKAYFEGRKHTEEVKAKMSADRKGKSRGKGRIFSEEHRARLSQSAKGRQAWNKGRPHPLETRVKMSRPVTEEMKEKLRIANTGKVASAAARMKMSGTRLMKRFGG